jgi:hypothetical protein
MHIFSFYWYCHYDPRSPILWSTSRPANALSHLRLLRVSLLSTAPSPIDSRSSTGVPTWVTWRHSIRSLPVPITKVAFPFVRPGIVDNRVHLLSPSPTPPIRLWFQLAPSTLCSPVWASTKGTQLPFCAATAKFALIQARHQGGGNSVLLDFPSWPLALEIGSLLSKIRPSMASIYWEMPRFIITNNVHANNVNRRTQVISLSLRSIVFGAVRARGGVDTLPTSPSLLVFILTSSLGFSRSYSLGFPFIRFNLHVY